MSQFSNKKVNRYFEFARQASLNSDFPKHHLGAVLIYKGAPLAHGCNSLKTSPVQKHYNRLRKRYNAEADFSGTNCCHAEINALTKVKYLDVDFSKVSIFIYREHRDGSKAMSKPCPACSAMIRDTGIKNVFYTTENGYCHEVFE